MSNTSNGNHPEIERLAPNAKPVWYLDGGDLDAELVTRTARLEGLRRALGEENES